MTPTSTSDEIIVTLSRHYKMPVAEIIAMVLRHEGANLLAMSDLSRKADPSDFLKLMSKRDEVIKETMRRIFDQLVAFDERLAEAKQVVVELRRTKALLVTRFAQSTQGRSPGT